MNCYISGYTGDFSSFYVYWVGVAVLLSVVQLDVEYPVVGSIYISFKSFLDFFDSKDSSVWIELVEPPSFFGSLLETREFDD